MRRQSRLIAGITETTGGYAGRQYRATLQAGLIHRLFLRCGRIHSGEERTPSEYHGEFIGDNNVKWLLRIRQQPSVALLVVEDYNYADI
ncbi:MAG: hypothetical protein M3P45_00905 [Acidobacteriota bacterium]|nr:hypothetical protein [Acidobacteriota bacterium]